MLPVDIHLNYFTEIAFIKIGVPSSSSTINTFAIVIQVMMKIVDILMHVEDKTITAAQLRDISKGC